MATCLQVYLNEENWRSALIGASLLATKVSSPGTSSRPTRADSRPQLREMLHESSDLLSHQAIMENFVRRRLIRRLSPRAPRAPAPQPSPLTPRVVPLVQVHHNPWEALQHMKWGDALNRVDKRLARSLLGCHSCAVNRHVISPHQVGSVETRC